MRLKSIFTGNGGGLGGTLGSLFGGLAGMASSIPQHIATIARWRVSVLWPNLPPEVLEAAQGLADAAAMALGALVLITFQVGFAYLFSLIGDMHAKNGGPKPPGAAPKPSSPVA